MMHWHSRNLTGYVIQEEGDKLKIRLETGEQLWITKPAWNGEIFVYGYCNSVDSSVIIES